MVERYNQGQLASPVVGTPGLDKSAGQTELQIAQTADAMRTSQNQMSMQASQRAEQSFNSAYSSFHQWGAERRYEARLQKAQENEQRRLQVQFDRLDEDDLLSGHIEDLQNRHAASPAGAVKEFTENIGVRRQEFAQRYANDPIKMRMLMPTQRASERGALNVLKQWASSTTTANLNKRLALMPEELTNKVSSLKGTLPEQLLGFQKALTASNSVYENMKNSAVSPADRDLIATKQMGLQQGAGKDFVNHVMAQVPDGEDGMKYLNTVAEALKDPAKNGINLAPEDHKNFVEHVHSQRSAHEQEVIVGIQGKNILEAFDANKLKNSLYRAADDPKKMNEIVTQVQSRLNDLDKQIALVSQEPESKIRNAKLAGLKQEQNIYINETGQELKERRSFEQLQRTLTSFARSNISFQHSMVSFAQGQQRFAQWESDLATKQVKNEADNIQLQKMDAFNLSQALINKRVTEAMAEPSAVKRQQSMQKIIGDAVPVVNNAIHSLAVKAESGQAYLDSLQKELKTAMGAKSSNGFFGIGANPSVPLKGDELKRAQAKAEADFASIVKVKQTNFDHMNDAMQQLGVLTVNKAEKTILTQQINTKMPNLLNSPGYQKMQPQQQAAYRARAVRAIVEDYRQGKSR